MNPSQYIISKLKSFIEDFPHTRVRYEYDDDSDTHFVEVVPNQTYHLDDNYLKWEMDLFINFVEQYPLYGICFISDDALVGLENVDFEVQGKYFKALYNNAEESITASADLQSVCCRPKKPYR